MGKSKLLIHSKNKIKQMQNLFYKTIIKKICYDQSIAYTKNFEDYYSMINDENLDVKYIVLKDNELRYN